MIPFLTKVGSLIFLTFIESKSLRTILLNTLMCLLSTLGGLKTDLFFRLEHVLIGIKEDLSAGFNRKYFLMFSVFTNLDILINV